MLGWWEDEEVEAGLDCLRRVCRVEGIRYCGEDV